MTGDIVTVSLPARFLSAGQGSVPVFPEGTGSDPDSFTLLIRDGGPRAVKKAGLSSCRQALLLPSGTPAPDGFVSGASAGLRWIRFRNAAGAASGEIRFGSDPVSLPEGTFLRVSCGFHQLAAESGGMSGPSVLCDYMLSSLLLVLRGESRRAPRSAAAARMLEYIRLHCCEQLTLPDVSRALGYSEDYLSRLLHEEVSCSFRRYIHLLRMQRAKAELLSGDRAIREIAAECGYSNAKFFSTSFLKCEGLTPSAFRNLYAAGSVRENGPFRLT